MLQKKNILSSESFQKRVAILEKMDCNPLDLIIYKS